MNALKAKTLHIAVVCLASITLSATVCAVPNIQAGLWEVTTRTEMSATDTQLPTLPPETKTQCITQTDAENPQSVVPAQSGCSINDTQVSGDSISWAMSCPGELPAKGTGETHYNGNTFSGSAKVVSEANGFRFDLTLTYTGRRVGECR